MPKMHWAWIYRLGIAMSFYRNKQNRDSVGQWYKDHLKNLSLGDEVAKIAIFKINGRYVHIDIPLDVWKQALTDHAIMRKLRIVVMDMAILQRKETKS